MVESSELMQEIEKLFEEYNKMGLDAKRNAYSEEMLKISLILKNILNKFGLNSINQPYNYRQEIDKNFSEEQLLNISYRDLYYLKVELLQLLNYFNLKDFGDK